ncbi:HAD-IC family P-type ATPase [Nitrosococcus wardiae]|uniref:HAD family hydrolase n=1 Tax=Nitrosococcus wardiae TaxID=1814290 RepID=A0A4P7C2I2_9GAMM|nr:HAD family hydrolase [Nitrosococcus wardiae]
MKEHRNWHALGKAEILDHLGSSSEGLSQGEAERRLAEVGPNKLPAPERRGPLMRFLAQFNNLLIYVLIGAAVLTAFLQHWVDTWVILGVVFVNAIIGFIQEGKAEKSLEAIRGMLSPSASVVRNGQRYNIAAEELVPGDVVLLEAGDKVPADLRLLQVKGLRIQEAVLTGESVAVDKVTHPVEVRADLGDRLSMAYSGTLVAAGQARGIVVKTGARTEIGRISGMISEVEELTTPLLQQMDHFARVLTIVILGVSAIVFLYGYLGLGQELAATFMTVVGLAVAAIPEGLPAILTVTLAIGVQKMAARNAIIRRLPAVETLGSVSVICSDKTGTLTRNEMTVRSVITAGKLFSVSGTGYEPYAGGFSLDGQEVAADDYSELIEMLRAGLLCNDSSLRHHRDQWQVSGDPMEGALLVAAVKAGFETESELKYYPRTDVIPFDSEHRFMGSLHHDHEGHGYIFIKGAPERVLDMCSRQRESSGEEAPLNRAYWEEQIQTIAEQGERVLAVATRPVAAEHSELNFADVEEGLVLLGLFGFIDPPREEAIAAIRECRSAGIRVKMITGDHAATARAIARQLGLENVDEVFTGRELDRLTEASVVTAQAITQQLERRDIDEATAERELERLADEALVEETELVKVASRVDVFARTTPEHKLRLVQALQAKEEVVAMTGDGVNDAPALKRADVGVAMGRQGTEAAKEAAEMVLADDNFVSIERAVLEGRTVYDNLKKAILFLLPVNGGESLTILAALVMGLTLPITPLQILWVNMVSSVALAMALAFEPPEPDVMHRRPRGRDEPLLSGFLLWRIGFVSFLFLVGIFGFFAWTRQQGASLEEARTYAVNTLVVMEVFYLFSARYLGASSLSWRGLKATWAVFIAVITVGFLQLIFTYAPFMERFFDTRPIDIVHGIEILAIGVLLFMVLEVEKWLRRRWVGAPAREEVKPAVPPLPLPQRKHAERKRIWTPATLLLVAFLLLWPAIGIWLHLDHLQRLDTKFGALTERLDEITGAKSGLNTQVAQMSEQLESLQETLAQSEQRWHNLRRGQQTLIQETASLRAGVEALANRVNKMEERTLALLPADLHDANWLLAQPADHYTLQLLTATDETWFFEFVQRYPLPSDSAYFRFIEREQYRYTLVSGVYESVSAARQALTELPQPWQRYNPWIRQIGRIHQEIQAQ